MLIKLPPNPIRLKDYEELTEKIMKFPYHYHSYLVRAYVFSYWGMDSLAIGDVYKALLLIDELQDESGEYHEIACKNTEDYPLHGLEIFSTFKNRSLPTWLFDSAASSTEWQTPDGARLLALQLLIYLLTTVGCLQSAWNFFLQLSAISPKNNASVMLKDYLLQHIRSATQSAEPTDGEIAFDPEDLPDRGLVHRILYPWNHFEPQRYSPENLAHLNQSLSEVAPKLRVAITELPSLSSEGLVKYEKQLGLVAATDISGGEELLSESSYLTANSRMYDPLCDACSGKLPLRKIGEPSFTCVDCDDTVFCCQECLDGAMESYHPAICGTGVETTAKEPPNLEAADALYFLLLGRTFALSAHQEVHPLELKETQFLWGELIALESVHNSDDPNMYEYDSVSIFSHPPKLPFSFKYNILYPLHYLEKMDIDVYAGIDRWDFWIFETLFAKFRGVASGKVNNEGVPEVSAVHPLWCLANHSCSPNVRWDWSGNMRFWTRTKAELINWGSSENEEQVEGVRTGDAILSHYCDVDLNFQQRREWARGALGGDCRCERCLWESRRPIS